MFSIGSPRSRLTSETATCSSLRLSLISVARGREEGKGRYFKDSAYQGVVAYPSVQNCPGRDERVYKEFPHLHIFPTFDRRGVFFSGDEKSCTRPERLVSEELDVQDNGEDGDLYPTGKRVSGGPAQHAG